MRLRTCKALKYFAILLFSFEMIAPALISSIDDDIHAPQQGQETSLSSNEHHFTNFISALLCEENSSEEEERESKDHKSTISFCDFDFFEGFATLIVSETRQTAWAEPHETTASHPPLFTLFHTYLI